jgi:hypothetical protein
MGRSLITAAVAAGLVAVYATSVSARGPALCFGKEATMVGTDAAETLTGTGGRDVIAGLDGGDTIDGKGGRDILCGREYPHPGSGSTDDADMISGGSRPRQDLRGHRRGSPQR